MPAQVLMSVVPVLHDPTGQFTVPAEQKTVKLAPDVSVVGTATSIFPQFGVFLTAAHVLRDPGAPRVATVVGKFAFLLSTPRGSGVVLPIRSVTVDETADVAIFSPEITFTEFQYPFVPVAPARYQADEFVLVAAGYPETTHSDKLVQIWPAAYVQEGAPTWVDRAPPHFETALGLHGPLVRVPMKGLRGLSGAPLLAFRLERDPLSKDEKVRACQAIGIMSCGVDDDHLDLAHGYFVDTAAALRLKLPFGGETRTLNEFLSVALVTKSTPHQDGGASGTDSVG